MDFNPFKKRISELNKLDPLPGNVLVAEPFMQDDYFKRSVVFLCENNKDGTVGFILNEKLNIHLNDLFNEPLPFNAELYMGGPVEAQNLFFLHTCEDLQDAVEIARGIYWSGDFEQLKEYMLIGKIEPKNIRFFLGYSGWDQQQLIDELEAENWLIGSIEERELFDLESEDSWKVQLTKMGKQQALMATFPDNPNLN
jgi:putative transcriptional regulator